MDPLTAIGLASNIVSFVDFAVNLISAAKEIHHSVSGATKSDQTLDRATRHLKAHYRKLVEDTEASHDPALDDILDLGEREEVAKELMETLTSITAKDPSSKRQSAKLAIKRYWKAKSINELKERLDVISSALDHRFQSMNHTQIQSSLERLVTQSDQANTNLGSLQQKIDAIDSALKAISLDTQATQSLRDILSVSEATVNEARQKRILSALRFNGIEHRFAAEEENTDEYETSLHSEAGDQEIRQERTASVNDLRQGAATEEVSHDRRIIEEHEAIQEVESNVDSHSAFSASSYSDFAEERVYLNERVSLDPRVLQARAAFRKWAQQDSAALHLLGKPGCGKSTLMKLLVEHPNTKQMLQVWAGEKKLVLSHFFFWKPGDLLQKSIDGLKRTLLYLVLGQRPELIPTVFAKQWTQTESTLMLTVPLDLQSKEIDTAFDLLLSDADIGNAYCFVFFLDGLDEFESRSMSATYTSLVRTLQAWLDNSPQKLKFCVSSREYPELELALQQHARIRLHEVTSRDIRIYIEDFFVCSEELQRLKLPDYEEQHLKEELQLRCSGVFLWVALVLRQMEQGLVNGDGKADMLTKLHSLPMELEDLLLSIFESMDQSRQSYCIALVDIVSFCERHRNNLDVTFSSIYFMLFVEAVVVEGQPQSLQTMNFSQPASGQDLVFLNRQLLQLIKRIKWRCGGLLDISSYEHQDSFRIEPDTSFLAKQSEANHVEGGNSNTGGATNLNQHPDELDTLLGLLNMQVGLTHRSVADLMNSIKRRQLCADRRSPSQLTRCLWQAFSAYVECAVANKAPLLNHAQRYNRGSDHRPGDLLAIPVTALLRLPQFIDLEGPVVSYISEKVFHINELAAKDVDRLGWVSPGSGYYGEHFFDVDDLLAFTGSHEIFALKYAGHENEFSIKSLRLLLRALYNHEIRDPLSDPEQSFRQLETVRVLLSLGLDVATPSLSEAHVCDMVLAKIVHRGLLGDWSNEESDLAKEIVLSMLAAGATPSIWATFERVPSSRDAYTGYAVWTTKDSLLRYGAPLQLLNPIPIHNPLASSMRVIERTTPARPFRPVLLSELLAILFGIPATAPVLDRLRGVERDIRPVLEEFRIAGPANQPTFDSASSSLQMKQLCCLGSPEFISATLGALPLEAGTYCLNFDGSPKHIMVTNNAYDPNVQLRSDALKPGECLTDFIRVG